jgi:hypothetical protein
MVRDRTKGSEVLDLLSDQFLLLMTNLIKGNMKRALGFADTARSDIEKSGLSIVSQNLIENLAQGQAMKNSIINLPSVVPGIGTILSFWLLGVENFFLLDQSVTLILALCSLHGAPVDDTEAMQEFAVLVVGDVFGIGGTGKKENFRSVSREYVTKTLPGKYVNTGVSRGVQRMLARLMPFRRGSRLLPAGLGLGASALNAYETMVNVGQTTLRHLPGLLNAPSEEV